MLPGAVAAMLNWMLSPSLMRSPLEFAVAVTDLPRLDSTVQECDGRPGNDTGAAGRE